jgi:hypothetical protein
MATGLRPVFLRLMTPNCEQLQTGSVKPMMLVRRMYDKYMSSLTLQMCSASQWMHLTTGQHSSLSICKVLVPWLRHHPNNCVHFHHITPGVELEDHQLAHILATSTRVKGGGAPVISANFARRGAVTRIEGWNSLFQSKKYIGSNFLTLYQRKDTPFVPTHVKSGPWMRKAGHSHSLTACLVRCTTGHAPIGVYCPRFFPEESTACRCGFPMETVSHILY